MIVTGLVALLTAILAGATLLSFLRISHGFVRIFSFPRLQILTLALVLSFLTLVLVGHATWLWTLFAVQVIVVALQAISIAPFLPIVEQQSRKAEEPGRPGNRISLLAMNVKMSNRDYRRAVDLVGKVGPDVVLAMETDRAWCEALSMLREVYPHGLDHPLPNGYGMALYSRLPLEDIEVHHLTLDQVPSIVATVRLRDGQAARLYCVHPEPPVPYADAAGRDAELLRIAEMVDDDAMPSIVFGDLNDVAWSHTTRLFQRLSRLSDPRIGRGFYNTFDARYPLMRWPLDHLFHDARFDLVAMDRLRAIGSDHFPMGFQLALTPDTRGARPEDENALDAEEIAAIYADADALDRGPVGADWERERPE